MYDVDGFQVAINQNVHIELKYSGLWFTWIKYRYNYDVVSKKLDQAFCNESWFSLYCDSRINCLPIVASNHALIVVDTFKKQNYKRHSF